MPDANVAKTLIRVFDLLRLLPKHGAGKTAGEMHEELLQRGYEIEKRTVERDLRMLQSAFPDYIGCDDRTKPFGWHWQAGRELCVTNILPSEAVVLKLIEDTLHGTLPAGLLSVLAPRFAQADLTLAEKRPDDTPATTPPLGRRIPAGRPICLPNVAPDILQRIAEALVANEQLEARYQEAYAPEGENLVLNPATLLLSGPIPYLVAFRAGTQTPELFALHRLTQVRCHHQRCDEIPPAFVLERFIDDVGRTRIGMNPAGNAAFLLARIDDKLRDELMDAPLSEDQQLTRQGNEWQIRATVVPDHRFKSWILQKGAAIRIDQPVELREQITAELRRSLDAYTRTIN